MESVIAVASAGTSYNWVIPFLVGGVLMAIAFLGACAIDGNKHSPLLPLILGLMALIGLLTTVAGGPLCYVYKDLTNSQVANSNARTSLVGHQQRFESIEFQMKEYAQKDLGEGHMNVHMGLFGGSVYGIYTTDQCLALIYEIPDRPDVYRAFRLDLEKTEIRSSGNKSPYFLLGTKIEVYQPCEAEDGSWEDNCKPDGRTHYRLVLSGYSYLYLPDGWEIY
jgi:hypothetical protein